MKKVKKSDAIKAYKVFETDWTCKGFQYEVGKSYTHKGDVTLCESGFHACTQLSDCFSYYRFEPQNKVAEVLVWGNVQEPEGDSKLAASRIKIVRSLSWHEVLDLANSGYRNSGNGNSGRYNSGDYNSGRYNSGRYNSGRYNSGDYNSGDYNSGRYNSGDYNSGRCNSGDCNSGFDNSGYGNSGFDNSGYGNSGFGNSGDCNSGHRNSGHGNSGDYNSGDYNSGRYNSGLFCTNEPKMRLFNRECEYTYSEFLAKFGNRPLNPTLTEWIRSTDMTDAEKEAHPSHETTGGYLKTFTYKEAWSNAWNNANDEQKRWFLSLPNFDADIFFEITGIEI